MYRLFVGLRPPAPIRALLLGAMSGVAGARWQADDQLHVTLRYIGEVDGATADDVAAALGSVYAQMLDLAVAGVGTFDARGRPEALWAGITPRQSLAVLHRKIDAALVRVGLPPERRAYLPHVTLARLNARCGPVEPFLLANAALASPRFTLDHFLLYESHLGRDRASYQAIARYRLA